MFKSLASPTIVRPGEISVSCHQFCTHFYTKKGRPDTSRRQRRRLPPCPLVIALVPLKCSSTILQFHHRVPFTKKKMPRCPCPFKNEAYSPEKDYSLFWYWMKKWWQATEMMEKFLYHVTTFSFTMFSIKIISNLIYLNSIIQKQMRIPFCKHLWKIGGRIRKIIQNYSFGPFPFSVQYKFVSPKFQGRGSWPAIWKHELTAHRLRVCCVPQH